MKFFVLLLLTLTTAFCLPGCGSKPIGEDDGISDEQLNTTDSKAELKARLTEVANTGIAGSALAGMRDSIEQIGDTALSGELLPLLDQLESAGSESKIKSLAKQMADKL